MRKQDIYFWVLLASFLLRLLLIGVAEISPALHEVTHGGDAIDYLILRDNLADQGFFGYKAGESTAFRMPGYPYFLLAFHFIFSKATIPILIFQALIDVLTGWFIISITVLLIKRIQHQNPIDYEKRLKWLPVLSAGFYLFNPIVAVNTISIYPEAPSTFLVVLACWALLKAPASDRYRLLAAAALAVSIYFKTTFASIAVLMITINAIYYLRARGWGKVVTMLLPGAVIVVFMVPWIVRNAIVFDDFVPLATSNGMNLYCGNNDRAIGQNSCDIPWVKPGLSEPASDRYYYAEGLRWIKNHPAQFVELIPKKLFRMLYPLSRAMSGLYPVPTPVYWALVTFVYAGLGLFFFGVLIFVHYRWIYPLFLLNSITAGLVLATVLSYGAYRFIVPALPQIAIITTFGWGSLFFAVRNWLRHRTITPPKGLVHP
jgi:hypothetical protein